MTRKLCHLSYDASSFIATNRCCFHTPRAARFLFRANFPQRLGDWGEDWGEWVATTMTIRCENTRLGGGYGRKGVRESQAGGLGGVRVVNVVAAGERSRGCDLATVGGVAAAVYRRARVCRQASRRSRPRYGALGRRRRVDTARPLRCDRRAGQNAFLKKLNSDHSWHSDPRCRNRSTRARTHSSNG